MDTASNKGIVLGAEGPFGGSKDGAFGGEAYAAPSSNPLVGASEFTAEAWVNWSAGASYNQPIFDFGESSSDYMFLTPASSALSKHAMLFEIHTSGGAVAQVSATKLAKGWEYVAVTETSSGTLMLYLDGEEVGKTTGLTITPASLGSASTAYLGKSLTSGTPMFDGDLSNVAFYSKALSKERIKAHYSASEIPANTIAPSISGTANDGSTQTAKAGTWTGLTPISFSYQWKLCNASGSACESIGSASEGTYKLIHGDVGSTLRVVVGAANSVGSGSATSSPTAVIEPSKPSNTTLPSITGSAQVGQLLSAGTGAWEGTPPFSYAYSWRNCNSAGESCNKIAGAPTTSTYRLPGSELGKRIQVQITATNSAGMAMATSATTSVVEPGPPTNTELPAITGTARDGQALKASTGAWAGTEPFTYSYRWQHCNSAGEGCENISGATSSSYTLGPSYIGSTIRVVVSAKNSVTTTEASSPASAVVTAIPPSNTTPPSISGTARDGQTLSASTGSWEGSPTLSYAYQWQRCNGSGESCTGISGATSSSYSAGHADVGHTLRVVVTGSNAGGSAEATSAATASVDTLPMIYMRQFGSEGTHDGQFDYPMGIATNAAGDVWVVDSNNDRVQEFSKEGKYITQFGSRGSGHGQLEEPSAIAVANGDVWVADTGNHRVEEFTEAGEYVCQFGGEGSGEGKVGSPEGIAVDAHGNVWVSVTDSGHLVVFDSAGKYVKTVGTQGSEDGQLELPVGLTIDSHGHVWVADRQNERVTEFSEAGEYLSAFGTEGDAEGQFEAPYGIATDSSGDVWVIDAGTNQIQGLTEDGEVLDAGGYAIFNGAELSPRRSRESTVLWSGCSL